MVKIFKAAKSKSKFTPITLDVDIDGFDMLGQGVCKQQSPSIFVKGALPKERCTITVKQKKKRAWFASVKQVLEPSHERITPFCPHVSVCGGCQLQHVTSEHALVLKTQAIKHLLKDLIARDSSWQPPLLSESKGYRRKAKLAFDGRNPQHLLLGFRGEGQSKIVDIKECQILVPDLQRLIAPIKQALTELSTPSAIGHVNLIHHEQGAHVHIHLSKNMPQVDRECWRTFSQQQHCTLSFSDKNHSSTDVLYYTQDNGVKIGFLPQDFIQVNEKVNNRMIAQAIDWLQLNEQDVVMDLFCGAGNFSIPLAKMVKQVLGIEGVSSMVQRCRQNAQLNGIDNTEFVHADLSSGKVLEENGLATCNKILLDPARDGADFIMPQLAASQVSHILYVSCNPSTFARDAALLCKGGYKLDKVGLLDMFPNTSHTEIMALFLRER